MKPASTEEIAQLAAVMRSERPNAAIHITDRRREIIAAALDHYAQRQSIANLPATPWTVQPSKGYATVLDAIGQPVIGLTDVELGWADTSTGPYRDPDSDLAEIKAIVAAVNLMGAGK